MPTTPGAFDRTFSGPGVFGGDAFVGRLSMLPTGVTAYGASSPGCAGPLVSSVISWPRVGNPEFSLTCSNAPPSSASGFLVLGAAPLEPPALLLGAGLWVSPSPTVAVLPAASNPMGAAEVALPIPKNAALVFQSFFAQFLWVGPTAPAPCPPLGISGSNPLWITLQP